MDLKTDPPATRRRGAALETALLDAIWDVATTRGYPALTFEAVAAQAGTSRPVVHRRWASRQEMLLAALRHRGAQLRLSEPDTGSLREDLRAVLRQLGGARADAIFLLVSLAWDLHRETGLPPEGLREHWVGDRGGIVQRAYERAVARGEIDPARITPRTIRLPGDLFRHEMLMTLRPPTDATIDAILDEVVLPLLGWRPTGATTDHGDLG